jgi:hypothetical protein
MQIQMHNNFFMRPVWFDTWFDFQLNASIEASAIGRDPFNINFECYLPAPGVNIKSLYWLQLIEATITRCIF